MDLWRKAIMIPVSRAFVYVVLTVWWVVPLLLSVLGRSVFHTIEGSSDAASDIFWMGFSSVVGMAVGFVVLTGTAELAGKAGRFLIPARVYTFLAIFLGAAFIAIGLRFLLQGPPFSYLQFIAACAPLGAAVVSLLIFANAAIRRAVSRMIELRQGAVAPESVATVHLLDAVVMAGDDKWRTDAECRWRILYDLEIASQAFRRDFPATFHSGDPIADAAAAKHYAAVAEGIRGLKKLVLVPRANSSATLREKAQSVVVALLDGAWDTLPRQDPVQLAKGALAAAWRTARVIFVAIIPLLILAAVKYYRIELPDELKQFAGIGAWVWAFVALMTVVDPEFGTKLGSLKDTFSLLGKEKK